MYSGHTIAVVVPAYNEEGFVGEVIETIPEYVDRVYVVDDASTDSTWAEIRQHATAVNAASSGHSGAAAADGGSAFDRRVVPIRHERNRGVGGAIKTGYLRALEDEIDVTAVMAGDGQMDPDHLSRLLDPIVEGNADYAKGNRLLYEEYREGMSTWRFFGNSVLTLLTKIASGYWKMSDPQNGYTAISLEALEAVDVGEIYEYYGYCNDLLVKLNASGMRVADVAMPAVYGEENSHIEYPTYIRKVSLMLLGNFCWRLKTRYLVRDFHPLALFYVFGAVTAAVGVVAGLLSAYSWRRHDDTLFVRASLSVVTVLTGSLSLLFAMLLDMQENEDREVQVYE
ncbi:glycosyltransferase family 2 protein [Natrialbaceae archaeon A-gly3]